MNNLNNDFAGFTGTEHFYKHWLGFVYTDGVKAMADKYGAYWLIDVIASYQSKLKKAEFQIWEIEASEGKAVVIMKEDTDRKPLVRQEIKYTTFPSGTFKLWLSNGTLLLPSEY